VVFTLTRRQRMRTGRVMMRDFDFTKPTQSLESSVDTMLTVGAQKSFQSFRYPGGYLDRSDGDARAKLAMEIEEAAHELLDGASTRLEIHSWTMHRTRCWNRPGARCVRNIVARTISTTTMARVSIAMSSP
jgi:uncharacterized protein involved in type VI secretion and phage assembly